MYLTKSDFKVARTCATKLYYRKLHYPSMLQEDEHLQFLADGGYMIEAIAKLCEPEGVEIGRKRRASNKSFPNSNSLGHNDSAYMVDMCEIAKLCYFHPKMKGRLSLKFVLPAVWATDETLHIRFSRYYGRNAEGQLLNPYDTLPQLPFGNPEADEETEGDHVVTEGTGAMRAYQEMLYGLHRNDDVTREKWRRLLLQYCELDTAAMVMVWMHWNQFGAGPHNRGIASL